MEERFRQMNGIYMDKLLEEEEAKNEHMDRKLDLIAQNLESKPLHSIYLWWATNLRYSVHEDGTTETSERIDELEEENERLRNEILALKRQLKNQSSPTKTRVRSKIFKSKPVMLDSDTENNLLATPVSVR